LITIGICDDQEGQIQQLTLYLHRYRGSSDFEVFHATSPEAFLALQHTRRPDLVFLDIDMAGMNGIQLGEAIRQDCPDTIIVYVTAHEEYALEAFRVRAFHYMIKPLTMEQFHQVLDEAFQFSQKRGGAKSLKTFAVQKKGELLYINYDDISYFEKIGHKICVHCADNVVEYYGNFTKLMEQIGGSSFLQCHQGYIVNIEKVRAFHDRTIFLDGNRLVPVSRSSAELVREALAKMLFAGEGKP
jgi:DNA-binding LytR/AlgR family response regulator